MTTFTNGTKTASSWANESSNASSFTNTSNSGDEYELEIDAGANFIEIDSVGNFLLIQDSTFSVEWSNLAKS